jgi:ABC-2 type transport system ATP-binding protein
VFLSSHNLNEIEKYCDRVIIIRGGKIIDDLDMKKVNKNRKKIVTYEVNGEVTSFEFDGDYNKLIAKLSKLDITNLEVRNKTVEEQFINYYKEDEKER